MGAGLPGATAMREPLRHYGQRASSPASVLRRSAYSVRRSHPARTGRAASSARHRPMRRTRRSRRSPSSTVAPCAGRLVRPRPAPTALCRVIRNPANHLRDSVASHAPRSRRITQLCRRIPYYISWREREGSAIGHHSSPAASPAGTDTRLTGFSLRSASRHSYVDGPRRDPTTGDSLDPAPILAQPKATLRGNVIGKLYRCWRGQCD